MVNHATIAAFLRIREHSARMEEQFAQADRAAANFYHLINGGQRPMPASKRPVRPPADALAAIAQLEAQYAPRAISDDEVPALRSAFEEWRRKPGNRRKGAGHSVEFLRNWCLEECYRTRPRSKIAVQKFLRAQGLHAPSAGGRGNKAARRR